MDAENGETVVVHPDEEQKAIEDVATTAAAVTLAQGQLDQARRQVRSAEINLARWQTRNEAARQFYHDMTHPSRLKSAIEK